MDKRGEVYFKSHTLHHHNVLCCHNTCLSLCLISFPPPRGPTQYFTDEGGARTPAFLSHKEIKVNRLPTPPYNPHPHSFISTTYIVTLNC